MEISKEELYKKYIIENCSKKETAEYFGTNPNTLRHYLDKYSIKKSKDLRLELAKKSTLEKYGVPNVWSKGSPIRDKIAQTNIEKYGATNVFSNKSTIRQDINVILKNKLPDTMEKIHKTNLEKYGSISPFGNKEVQEKCRATCLERYSVSYYLETNNLNISKHDILEAISTFNKKPTLHELSSKLNIGYSTMSRLILDYNLSSMLTKYDSYLEIKFMEILDQLDIKYQRHNRTLIKPYEIDFYLPDYNIAFEINDFATHLDKTEYHQMKRDMCSNINIDLYFIWENQIVDEELYIQLTEDIICILELYKI